MTVRMLRCTYCEEVRASKTGIEPGELAQFVNDHETDPLHPGRVEATELAADGSRCVRWCTPAPTVSALRAG